MAANTRAKTTGWSVNELVTAAQMNAADINGAQSVNRNSTVGGAKCMPICYIGSTVAGVVVMSVTNLIYLDPGNYYSHFALVGLPHGHVLNSVTVYLKPHAHGGNPGVTPVLSVWRAATTGAVTQIGADGTYSWVDLPTYEAGISLTCGSLAHTIASQTYDYRIRIEHESGANDEILDLSSIVCNVTIDAAYGGADLSFWR